VAAGPVREPEAAGTRTGVVDRIAEPWGERTPYGRAEPWPARVDEHLAEEPDRWVQTASVLHSNGDAYELAVKDRRLVGVRGREGDRVNRGRLGPKDLYAWQAMQSPDRLTRALVRDGGELRETGWDEAMDRIVGRSRELLDEKGPGAFGFYSTGQLFLEEYYTLAVVSRAGIGTNHVDGNTRLCTATADEALKQTFGCDGQPGSYTDVDHCDTLFLVGHNVAETQPVLWMRMLDRLHGRDRPRLVVVDPRRTATAAEADVHLAVKPGGNVPLLNGILRELIVNERIDREWIAAHTVGFDELRSAVMTYTLDHAAELAGVPARDIAEAARIIGDAEALLSTVLQGVYQSHQATAAAVQVNNINLVRGMLGRPGAGILQMNGQPTAQNTRECGANGDLPGFRNWANEDHVAQLARIWNVDPLQIPHYGPSTHAMEIFRHCEDGTIGLLWVIGTNPAVSLPELERIRSVLGQERLFLVVQDLFPTETTALADVVLPAAGWSEKTGAFTNADRTVHLSEEAIDPPGEARSDLDILLDYARRMDFRDKDGEPLVKWHDAESAYRAWQECSKGRPCDYSQITYERLRVEGGVQWGGERLYTDGRFFAAPDVCESYGMDLATGAHVEPTEYRALNPDGKAILKAADHQAPLEEPSDDFPMMLTTGRTIWHFHTRTKTGRTPELQRAAPEPWVELCMADLQRLGIAEGDAVEVATPRGAVRVPARAGDLREGVVFLPFHYGYWDQPGDGDHDRAANELTLTAWDPVSKQPLFKNAACRVTPA
jgi:anaerobic selenocysteine-containing dehydrogenase